MNKLNFAQITSVATAILALGVCANANAMPMVAIDECVGLLGPLAQLPIQNPVVEQAIDQLKSRHFQINNDHKSPTIPETTISRRRSNTNRVLIMGGPENIPM